MKIVNLHHFLKSYFVAHNCKVSHDSEDCLTVELTEEIDKQLMNRPFYWHYVKSIGRKGEPMKLTFITNPNCKSSDGEWIHFGSPRLQKIFSHLRNNKFVKLFQVIQTRNHTPLYPWLLTNIKISYQGKHKKEEIFSIGLQLISGLMKVNMMELLKDENLQMTISDFCYPMSPLIKLNSGYRRIESVIDQYICNQEHKWAQDSLKELKNELMLLDHFYYDKDDDSKYQHEKERKEIFTRYTPTITYEVMSGGLIYLSDRYHQHPS